MKRHPTGLVIDACLHLAKHALVIPDTGSLRSDLVSLQERLVALLGSPLGQALLALSVLRHPDAVAAWRRYWRQRFDLARAILNSSVSWGEFAREADPIVFLEVLIAPALFAGALAYGTSGKRYRAFQS
jgi:hypothetical protein